MDAKDKTAATEREPAVVKTLAEVAAHFGNHVATVRYWLRVGMPVAGVGRYDLAAISRWYAKRVRRPGRPVTASPEFEE